MKLSTTIESLLNKNSFDFSSIELSRKGQLKVTRILTESDSQIIELAKVGIFKPLQREAWVLADLLGTVTPANESDSVAYFVATNLDGLKVAIWVLNPDSQVIESNMNKVESVLSPTQQEMINQVVATVGDATVTFQNDMAIIEMVINPSETKRTVHNLIFALGSFRTVYGGMAWFNVNGNTLTVHIVPDMNRVIYTLRLANKISKQQERKALGNWGGLARQDVVAMVTETVLNGSDLDESVDMAISVCFTGLDPAKAAKGLSESVLNELPMPKISIVMLIMAMGKMVNVDLPK